MADPVLLPFGASLFLIYMLALLKVSLIWVAALTIARLVIELLTAG